MFNVNSMLADMARVANGKLDVWGGGWSITSPGSPFAVFGKIDVPWHLRAQQHTLRLDLIDTDGEPFVRPEADDPLTIPFPPYDPAGLNDSSIKPGTPIDWPFSINFVSGLPLDAGTRYEFRIFIDGRSEEGWTLPFSTRPEAQPDSLAA
jgi:hypothetical protein